MGAKEVTAKAIINISGGTISELLLEGASTANISGGVISELKIVGGDAATYDDFGTNRANIIGYDLNAVPYGGAQEDGQVTGWWNNDTYFTIVLRYECTYGGITLYDGVIPPDCVNRPESDLNGDCKVNVTDFSRMASEWLVDGTE